MSRLIQKHNKPFDLSSISPQRLEDFDSWLHLEIHDALAGMSTQKAAWKENMRMYDGVPKLVQRNSPVEGAPNIEITVGAISSDMIYAQAVDMIFSQKPIFTTRPKPNAKDDLDVVKAVQALQKLVVHLSSSKEVNLREAADTAILTVTKLGTAGLYVPFVQKVKKTKTSKVLSASPRIFAMPIEDVIVPSGTMFDVEEMHLFGLRFYKTLAEIGTLAANNKNWDLDGIAPVSSRDPIRTTRETLSRHNEGIQAKGKVFDMIDAYCLYDIDGDGIEEDLYVVWNHSGKKRVYLGYNPVDTRQFEKMVYQKREHMFFGIGVLEMLRNFEEKLTDVHNYATLNLLLANSRIWKGSGSLPDTIKIWPGRYIPMADTDDLEAVQMADVYNSIWQDQALLMQLANQRVGINNVSSGGDLPSRTPGITAMSFLQQINRRFTPAFDSMRRCLSGAMFQCIQRIRERVLVKDQNILDFLTSVVGYEDVIKLIKLLLNPRFDEMVDLELTATSASVNQEADRQNSIILTNILAQYYQRTLELVNIASQPTTAPEVRSVAIKIIESAGQIIDRTIRTFDNIRDPSTFVIEVENEMNQLQQTGGSDQLAVQQLVGMLTQGAGMPPQNSQGGGQGAPMA